MNFMELRGLLENLQSVYLYSITIPAYSEELVELSFYHLRNRWTELVYTSTHYSF